jgi:hypothetical protein
MLSRAFKSNYEAMITTCFKINVKWKPFAVFSAPAHYDIQLRLLLTNLFIHGSFNAAFGGSDYVAPGSLINNKQERTRKERVVVFRLHPRNLARRIKGGHGNPKSHSDYGTYRIRSRVATALLPRSALLREECE